MLKAQAGNGPSLRLVRVHEAATRLRLRVEPACDADRMADLADRLARIPGVAYVVGRPNTGSVILTVTEAPQAVLSAIEAAGVARIEAAPKSPPVGQVLTLGLLQLDMGIRKRSENAVDLRSSLALLLIFGTIVQAARGRVVGPASSLALAAYSLLDTSRR